MWTAFFEIYCRVKQHNALVIGFSNNFSTVPSLLDIKQISNGIVFGDIKNYFNILERLLNLQVMAYAVSLPYTCSSFLSWDVLFRFITILCTTTKATEFINRMWLTQEWYFVFNVCKVGKSWSEVLQVLFILRFIVFLGNPMEGS